MRIASTLSEMRINRSPKLHSTKKTSWAQSKKIILTTTWKQMAHKNKFPNINTAFSQTTSSKTNQSPQQTKHPSWERTFLIQFKNWPTSTPSRVSCQRWRRRASSIRTLLPDIKSKTVITFFREKAWPILSYRQQSYQVLWLRNLIKPNHH